MGGLGLSIVCVDLVKLVTPDACTGTAGALSLLASLWLQLASLTVSLCCVHRVGKIAVKAYPWTFTVQLAEVAHLPSFLQLGYPLLRASAYLFPGAKHVSHQGLSICALLHPYSQ